MIWATRGAIVIGLMILGYHLVSWYPGFRSLRKKPQQLAALLPFLFGWAYGALGVLTVMGFIGWIFDATLWVSNWLGDAALVLGVGASAGVSARGNYLPLTDDGSALVLVLTAVVMALRAKGRIGSEVVRGVWCGCCLGTASGVAGALAVPLAQAANTIGMYLFGWVG